MTEETKAPTTEREIPDGSCMHAKVDIKWSRTIVVDSNVGVLNVKMTCTVCKKQMKFLGLTESNVLKKRPFTHDNGLTATIPFVAEGEAVMETPTMSMKN